MHGKANATCRNKYIAIELGGPEFVHDSSPETARYEMPASPGKKTPVTTERDLQITAS